MSNSIWKKPDIKPDGERLYVKEDNDGVFVCLTNNVSENAIRWAYIDDIIAQADKAERLEKENEAMREEFEVWHGNHKCVLEDNERLQKAVDKALQVLDNVSEIGGIDLEIAKIKQLIKGE